MFQLFLFNLSILVILCACSSGILKRFPDCSVQTKLWQGVLFGSIAVVGMLYPVRFESGAIFDGRSVVLSLAAWFFGFRSALLASGLAVTARLMLGGPAAYIGSASIISASIIGLVFRRWVKPEEKVLKLRTILLMGFVTHVIQVLLLYTLFTGEDREFFVSQIALPMLVFYPLTTLMAGWFITGEQVKRKTFEALKQSENRFRALFESSHVVMLLMDSATGTIVDANSAAAEYYGWSLRELCGMNIGEINTLTPEEIQEVMASALNQTRQMFRFKHRLASGEVRDVEVYSSPIDEGGRPLLYSMVFDVFRRKESEQSLNQALMEKATVLEASMLGYVMLDASGTVVDCNERYSLLTGYTLKEMQALGFSSLLTAGAEREKFKPNLAEILSEGEKVFDSYIVTKQGDTRLVEVSAKSLPLDDEIRICAFLRDITDLRRSEEQMRLLSAAMAAAANRVVITDPNGRILWANKAFLRHSGYTLAEAKDKKPGDLIGSGKHDETYFHTMWKTLQRGEVWSGEITNKTRAGEFYVESMTITPQFNEEGEILNYISIKQDITEQKALQEMFERSQRLEGIGRLSSGIAHDLNNILSPIMMSADVLSESLANDADRELADMIINGCKRGAGIIKQLLSYARGIRGEKTELNLVHLLKEVLKFYRETLPRTIRIEDAVGRQLDAVFADPGQVHQMLSNLLVNARDALPPEGGEIRLEAGNVTLDAEEVLKLHGSKVGSYVRIAVEDTGTGITEELLEKIFDPFFTTKEEGKGTGLGLATTRNLVKEHDGFMRVTSVPGEGSRFEIYLPIASQSSLRLAKNAPPRLAADAKPAAATGKPLRVLVVDDEESVRGMLKHSLGKLGYEVETLSSGEEALARLKKDPLPDLLLIDFMMEGISGAAVLDELDKQSIDIPALVISGMIPEEEVQEGKVRGRNILEKPFSIKKLASSMETII